MGEEELMETRIDEGERVGGVTRKRQLSVIATNDRMRSDSARMGISEQSDVQVRPAMSAMVGLRKQDGSCGSLF
jgi:hypothetical protein